MAPAGRPSKADGRQAPDEDGFHYVTSHDGATLRFKLLLGGPDGNHRINPRKRVAVFLHGVGESLAYWEDVFRTQPLPRAHRFAAEDATGVLTSYTDMKQDPKRRAQFSKMLAKHMNVVLVDQRGFGCSGRPCSTGPMEDESLSVVSTYQVNDIQGFTKELRIHMEESKRDGVESDTAAILGNMAVHRVAHPSVMTFVAYLQSLQKKSSSMNSHATLKSLEISAPPDVLETLKELPSEFTSQRELRQLKHIPGSFTVDRMGCPPPESEVAVIHRLSLKQGSAKFCAAAACCIEEMKAEPSCLSFAISCCKTYARALGVFPSCEAALSHLKTFRQWMVSENIGLSSFSDISSVQVHARTTELKKLRAFPEVEQSVQLCQVFPLSFETCACTETSPTMSDFVEDVESILKYVGVSQATIVGHSMGAAVALAHSASKPSSVERLCTIAGASRTGKIAFDIWQQRAGTRKTWTANVTRGVIAVVNIDNSSFQEFEAPSLLVNASDDLFAPLLGAQILKSAFPNCVLEVPTGGHDCMVINDEPFERMVRFMVADTAMVFAKDPLLTAIVTSPWNLPGDEAFMRYYRLGCALSEVERVQRRLRLLCSRVRDAEYEDQMALQEPGLVTQLQLELRTEEVMKRQDGRAEEIQAEQQDIIVALANVGLQDAFLEGAGSSKEILLKEMSAMLPRMSSPALLAVEQAGTWWRDTGESAKGLTEGKYTVDAWGRRRGGSKTTGCVWFRWDTNLIPYEIREGFAYQSHAEVVDSEMFACWWCGGSSADHEDLGPMRENEEPGFFPGKTVSRRPNTEPIKALALADEDPGSASFGAGRWGPTFKRVDLSGAWGATPTVAVLG